MIIRIEDLRLRAEIGVNEWERSTLQDLVINVNVMTKTDTAAHSDELDDTVDYRSLTKRIIEEVESSHFMLIEGLAGHVLRLALEDPGVHAATVRVAKPHALRFADSVSVELTGLRGQDPRGEPEA